MIDIDSFIKGLKVSWIRNLYIKTAAPWVQLAKYIVGDINKIALVGSDWTVQRAKQMDNHFWKDVLSAWACVLQNIHQKCSIYEKLHVPLWYNPEITRATLYIPELYQQGILYPIDLTRNGDIMTRENIALFYNISLDFFTYHRLYLCLKKLIGLTNLNTNAYQRPIFPTQVQLLHKSRKGTKDFYNIILPSNIQGNNFKKKWETDLSLILDTLT